MPVGDADGLVPVGDGVGLVPVGDGVGVAVRDTVGVAVGDGVGLVPVGDGVGVAVRDGVGVAVRDGVGVAVRDGVGVAVRDGVGVAVRDGVGVAVGDGVGLVPVGDGVGDALMLQAGTVMASSSRVTAPLRASTRPMMVSPVCTVIDVRARTVPAKVELVAMVAELPTCQKTLHAWAPLARRIVVPVSVIRVDPAWKMKTAFGSPPASRVSEPPTANEDVAL